MTQPPPATSAATPSAQGGASQPPDEQERSDLKDQWSSSIDTFRYLWDLLSKVWGFIAAADAAVLGYGFISGTAGPVFISALLTALIGAVTYMVYTGLLPVAYTAYDAEMRLGMEPGLVQFTVRVLSKNFWKEFEDIRKGGSATRDEVVNELRRLRRRPRVVGKGITAVLAAGTVAQAAVGFYYLSQGAELFTVHSPSQSTVSPAPSSGSPVSSPGPTRIAANSAGPSPTSTP